MTSLAETAIVSMNHIQDYLLTLELNRGIKLKKTHSESLMTQSCNSIACLPINQTRFEKYGSAVLSQMKFSIPSCPTKPKITKQIR